MGMHNLFNWFLRRMERTPCRKVKSKSKTGGGGCLYAPSLILMVPKAKNTPTAPDHPFPHHFLIRHNTSIHPFTISYSRNRLHFLVLSPGLSRSPLSRVLLHPFDVNNGRFIAYPTPKPTMPPSLHLDHLLSSTDHTDFSARRQLSDVSAAIAKARRIVTVSGAGISCSSGIPVSILFSLRPVRRLFCVC